MTSHLTCDFKKCFFRLPEYVKKVARKNYWIGSHNDYEKLISQMYGIKSLKLTANSVAFFGKAIF